MFASRSLVLSCLVVSTVCLAVLLQPVPVQSTRASSAAATIDLTGAVRDFRRDHPDFDITPSNGLGHYANTVELWAGATPP